MAKKGEFVKANKRAGQAARKTVNDMFSPIKEESPDKNPKEPTFGYYYALNSDMMQMLNRIAFSWGCKKSLPAVFVKLLDEGLGEVAEIKKFADEYVVTTSFRAVPPKRSGVQLPLRMKPIIDELQVQLEIRKYTDLMRLLIAYYYQKLGLDKD